MEEGKLIGQDSDVDKCDQILRWRFNFTRRNSISLQQEKNKMRGWKKQNRILRETRHLKWREGEMTDVKLNGLSSQGSKS